MIYLAAVGLLTALVVAYVLWIRTWLRTSQAGWAKRFMTWIEPFELRWFKKSETWLFHGWIEIVSLATIGLDLFIRLLEFLAAIDPNMLAMLFPEHAGKAAAISYFIGLIGRTLRERTTKPVELVAVPANAPLKVQIAVAQAASANTNAVEVVQAAKDAGTIPKT